MQCSLVLCYFRMREPITSVPKIKFSSDYKIFFLLMCLNLVFQVISCVYMFVYIVGLHKCMFLWTTLYKAWWGISTVNNKTFNLFQGWMNVCNRGELNTNWTKPVWGLEKIIIVHQISLIYKRWGWKGIRPGDYRNEIRVSLQWYMYTVHACITWLKTVWFVDLW